MLSPIPMLGSVIVIEMGAVASGAAPPKVCQETAKAIT
jgi:hypothetical protein